MSYLTTHPDVAEEESQWAPQANEDRPLANAAGDAPSFAAAPRPALHIANADPRYAHVRLIEPTSAGFLHFAVQTAAQQRPGPVRRNDEQREAVIDALTTYARAALGAATASEAAVFRAVLVAPAPGEDASGVVQPDTAMLLKVATPASAVTVAASPEAAGLLAALRAAGARAHVLAARNVRRIADVEHRSDGLYLFNHFLAADEGVAVALWDCLAGWYQRETGLDNSVLLAPAQGQPSVFAIVNHARFAMSLPGLAVRQFAKPSFYRYVQANLRANGVVAVPALYRLAWAGRGQAATMGA